MPVKVEEVLSSLAENRKQDAYNNPRLLAVFLHIDGVLSDKAKLRAALTETPQGEGWWVSASRWITIACDHALSGEEVRVVKELYEEAGYEKVGLNFRVPAGDAPTKLTEIRLHLKDTPYHARAM